MATFVPKANFLFFLAFFFQNFLRDWRPTTNPGGPIRPRNRRRIHGKLVGIQRANYHMGGIPIGGAYPTPDHSIFPALSTLFALQDRDPPYLSAGGGGVGNGPMELGAEGYRPFGVSYKRDTCQSRCFLTLAALPYTASPQFYRIWIYTDRAGYITEWMPARRPTNRP